MTGVTHQMHHKHTRNSCTCSHCATGFQFLVHKWDWNQKLLLTKNERRMQRQEMIAFLAGCLSASDGFRFNKKIIGILSESSGLFRQSFLDPAQVFGYVNIDVGQIRVVTVSIHVERHNANRLLAAHQWTPRVALWGRRSCSHYYIIAVYWRLEQLFSLNGRTYLTESYGCVAASADHIFGEF